MNLIAPSNVLPVIGRWITFVHQLAPINTLCNVFGSLPSFTTGDALSIVD